MGKAEQLTDFIDTIIKIILQNIFPILLLLVPVVVFIIFNKRFIDYEKDSLKEALITLVIMIVFQIIGSLSLFISSDETYSAKSLYYDIHSPTLSTNKLGLLTTMRLDFKRMLLGFEESSELDTKPVKNDDDDEISETPTTYNEMNIDFDTLIQNESNKTVRELHEYFKNAEATKQNDYTGMFKGKNLIVFLFAFIKEGTLFGLYIPHAVEKNAGPWHVLFDAASGPRFYHRLCLCAHGRRADGVQAIPLQYAKRVGRYSDPAPVRTDGQHGMGWV
jgi:hypothetical protein